MSGFLAGKVWHSALSRELKPLAATLADLGNDDGSGIWPSRAYLCWLLDWSESSVKRGMADLRKLGVMTYTANAKGGRGNVPHYKMSIEHLPARRPWAEVRAELKGVNLTHEVDEKGVNLTHEVDEKGVNLTHEVDEKGVTEMIKGVKSHLKGVTAMAPEPSVRTVSIEPPINPPLSPLVNSETKSTSQNPVQKIDTVTEQRPVEARAVNVCKAIPDACLRILGIPAESKRWAVEDYHSLKKLAQARGSGLILSLFEKWAEEHKATVGKYPIREFLRSGATTYEPDTRLPELLRDMGNVKSFGSPSEKSQRVIGALLADYSPAEILLAWRKHIESCTEWERENKALQNFCEGAIMLLLGIRYDAADAQQQELAMQKAAASARLKAEDFIHKIDTMEQNEWASVPPDLLEAIGDRNPNAS